MFNPSRVLSRQTVRPYISLPAPVPIQTWVLQTPTRWLSGTSLWTNYHYREFSSVPYYPHYQSYFWLTSSAAMKRNQDHPWSLLYTPASNILEIYPNTSQPNTPPPRALSYKKELTIKGAYFSVTLITHHKLQDVTTRKTTNWIFITRKHHISN